MKLQVTVHSDRFGEEVEVIDSRLIAKGLNIQHPNFVSTLKRHINKVEQYGKLIQEEEEVRNSVGALNRIKYYWLRENQAIFMAMLSNNSEEVIEFKGYISDAFSKLRREKELAIQENQSKHIIPQKLSEALFLAAQQAVLIEAQTIKIQEDKPKVEFYDRVANKEDLYTISQLAKTLDLTIGRNDLLEILHKQGFLGKKNKNTSVREPYQQWIDSGHFKMKIEEVPISNLVSQKKTTVYVTGKGFTYLSKNLEKYFKPKIETAIINY